MSVRAQLPDGTTLEFPEGTDDAVIDRTVKGQLGVQEAPEPTNPVARAPGTTRDGTPTSSPTYGGAGQESEGAPFGNMFRGAAERGADLVGNLIEAAGRLPGPGGLPPVREISEGADESVRRAGEAVSDLEVGYEPEYTWERVKEDPSVGNVVGFMAEQGIRSTPDMAAVMASLPAYVASRAEEIATQRARNDGREEPEQEDFLKSVPTALATAAMERVGARGVTRIGAPGTTRGAGGVARETGKAAAREGATEFAQENIEYAGETVGTDAPYDPAQGLDRGLAGAVAGSGFGGTVRASTATAEALTDRALGARGSAPPEPETTPESDLDAMSEPTRSTEGVATKTQRASAGEVALDEVVPERRVADMTPEEMQSALLHSDVTGLPNRRAFIEAKKRPGRVSADVDSLKWVNDNISHDAGNSLLNAVGRAFQAEGVDAYHISGDEFLAQGDSVDIAQEQMDRVSQRLEQSTFRATMPDGQAIEITPRISYGAGQTLTEAEQGLGQRKAEREQAGERAPRGERPPTVRDVEAEGRGAGVQPQGRQDRGDPSGRVEAMQPGVDPMMPGANYQPMLREAAPVESPTISLSGERQVEVPSEPIRRRNIIRSIEREFGNRIYTGRIKGKTMLGFHRKPNNEIRTKRTDDLEVTAHELAHWIDDRYPAFAKVYRTPKYAGELKGISYDANKVHEGFAEFVRLYMTQESEARTRAPQFFEQFQKILSDTGLTQKVNRIQEHMHAWYYQGAKQRLASKMGASQSIRQRLDAALDRATDRFVTHSLDGLHEIAVAEKDLQGYIADATQSPYKAFRLVAGARGTIKSIYHYGTVGWNAKGDIHFTGKSMESVFAPISDNLENAKHYFIARRAKELKKQGRENLIEQDEIDAGLREGDSDPRLKTAFDEWIAFNKRMMDFYEDSGIVSAQSRAAMEDANKDYVPFQRIIETVSGDERTRTGAFQRLRGGTQNLGDIFENMEQSVATLTRMALINRAKQLAYDMVDKSRGGSYYAVKVPKETKPVQVNEEDLIAKIVPGFGLTPSQFRRYRNDGQIPQGMTPQAMEAVELVISRMAAMDQFTTFFQHGQAPQGDNIDTVMRNGETEYYEVGDPLWVIAMSHFGPKNINMALKIAGGFSNTLRRSVTSMPSFLIPNLVRDGTNAIMFSRGGWKGRTPFAGAIGGWSAAIRRDQKYWEFMANGGGFSSTVHGEVEQSVQRFYEREGVNYNSVLDTPRKMLDNWDTIASAFEYGTRLGEFQQTQQQGASMREAALSGREISTDFSMHGASQTLGAIRMSVPFFNTRVQGMYKIVREAGATKERGGSATGMAAALAIRGLSLLTLPSLALWAWNNMDDERKEKYQALPNWVRDMHWVVYVPGREAPYLIPKPFEVGAMFASVPERMADAMTAGDGEDLGPALHWILAEQLNLAPMPQIFNPVYEDMTNENFMGMPVIPPDLQDVDPVEQFKPWTSDTSIAIGKKLGVSPTKVDHYIRGYFGTLGAQALASADMMLHDEERYGERPEMEVSDYPIVRRFTGKSPQTSTKQQREWYDFMQSIREAQSTVSKIVSEGRDPEQYLASRPETRTEYAISQSPGYRGIGNAINEIQKTMEQIRTSKDMSGEQKRDEMDQLQRQLNEVYRQGVGFAEEVSNQGQ